VVAFAIRHLGADAGVMVTASHNPPQDNGYKVYLGDGSQIVPPTDAQIASHIAAVASVRDLPLVDDGWENLGDEVQDAYVARVAALLPAGAATDISVVHTALHGVGDDHWPAPIWDTRESNSVSAWSYCSSNVDIASPCHSAPNGHDLAA